MTGTQSLSLAQLRIVNREVDAIEVQARRRGRENVTEQGLVYSGQPVTVVIHQAEPGWELDSHYRVEADKRVQVHRAFADSHTFWISRSGQLARAAHRRSNLR